MIRASGNNFGTLSVDHVKIDSSGQALDLSNGSFAAGASFAGISSTGGVNNVELASVAGTVNLGTGALSGATGTGFSVTGGNANIDYNGSIARCPTMPRRSGCRATPAVPCKFDGTVSSTGSSDGITLENNGGATVNFTNTLDAQFLRMEAGFSATGGGTVTATGSGQHDQFRQRHRGQYYGHQYRGRPM